ncbi:MAG: murein hydrolase activator EnvC family protein [Candidatus Aquicultorales bacterium]
MQCRLPSKLTAVALIFMLIALTPSYALADLESEIQAQIEAINGQNEQTRSKLDANKASQNQVLSEIADLDQRIIPIKAELERLTNELNAKTAERTETERQLEALKAEIARTVAELNTAKAQLAKQQKVLNNRIRRIYQHGKKPYIQVVLESASFADFINRMSFLNYVVDQDTRILNQIKELKRQIEVKEAKLRRDRDVLEQKYAALLEQERAIARLRGEQDAQRHALQVEIDNRAALVAKLRTDAAALQAAADQEAADVARLQSDLIQWREEQERAEHQSSRGDDRSYSSSGWVWPADGPITSYYGYRVSPTYGASSFHQGIDIGAPEGAPVYAANGGYVSYVGYYGGFGMFIVVEHGNGVSSSYAHLSGYAVGTGETVGAGQVIGYVGSTGVSTGPHLDFRIYVDGVAQDPLNWY